MIFQQVSFELVRIDLEIVPRSTPIDEGRFSSNVATRLPVATKTVCQDDARRALRLCAAVASPMPHAGFPSQAWGVVSICRIVGIGQGGASLSMMKET